MNQRDLKDHRPLRELAKSAGLPIGAAVDMKLLSGSDPRYKETLQREFNACVAENAFKPSEVWIGPREYDFSVTDRLADLAAENGMLLRGHTLVWHQQTPRWLKNEADHPSPDELKVLLRDYIHAVVGRYKGRVAHWDVVNEAVHDPGVDGAAPGLREDSLWHRALGPEYLRLAFQWAHEADPDARLYYNDYEIEAVGPKSDAVYALICSLIETGAPIDGIGFQGHFMNGWRATDAHRANIRRFVELGLEWAVTEADIRMELNGNPPGEEQLATQAAGFEDLTRLCRTEENCRGLIFWGFTDAHSWIPGFRKGWGASLPLDEAYRPKPAYCAVSAALAG
ncbi:MAG: endo-1,4-beta-xylanase [Armatimonadota bacterium]